MTTFTPPPPLAELRSWALRYAAAGFAVLPLHSIYPDGRCTCRRPGSDSCAPGKHPATEHGKDDASTDLEQVARWWERYSWNIGVRPPDGMIVLDEDPRNGGDLRFHEQVYGPLPRTLIAQTGSGGRHVWLRYDGPAAGRLGPGIDVKTSRGYLVAPPSIHASGGTYDWTVLAAIAAAPLWVGALLNPPPRLYPPPTFTGTGQLAPLLRVVLGAEEGERNKRLYWAAVRAHRDGLDVTPLIDAVVGLGESRRAAERTAESARKAANR